jgi:hypothetical protein
VDVRADGAVWPPSIGDYVRLRNGGALAEVIDISIARTSSRYTLNVFTPSMAEPVSFRLDELESVWQGWPSAFADRRRERERPAGWRSARPS